MHADAHNVARMNGLRINLLQGFVYENGSPADCGVAAAAQNHRGVITAVPNDCRWD